MQNCISFRHPQAARVLAGHFRSWRGRWMEEQQDGENGGTKDLVFFCIGSTRVPGDSLGPLVGEALRKHSRRLAAKSIFVEGDACDPIHALNLADRYALAKQQYPNAMFIAVDAGLGLHEQIGTFAVWEGSLSPGIALQKNLPPVGDFGVAGIVGACGSEGFGALQSASVNMVKKMADRIAHAICHI